MPQSLIDYVNSEYRENQNRFIEKMKPFTEFLEQGYKNAVKKDEQRKIDEANLNEYNYMADKITKEFPEWENDIPESFTSEQKIKAINETYSQKKKQNAAIEIEKRKAPTIRTFKEKIGDNIVESIKQWNAQTQKWDTISSIPIESNKSIPTTTEDKQDEQTLQIAGYDTKKMLNEIGINGMTNMAKNLKSNEKTISYYEAKQAEYERKKSDFLKDKEIEGDYYWTELSEKPKKYNKGKKEGIYKKDDGIYYVKKKKSEIDFEDVMLGFVPSENEKKAYEEAKSEMETLNKYKVGSNGTKQEISDEDQQAMEWLQANPNDPRSEAIKKALKAKGLIK